MDFNEKERKKGIFKTTRQLLVAKDASGRKEDEGDGGGTEQVPSFSTMLHAFWSVDHYPNWLLKQSETQLDELSRELEAMRKKIDDAKRVNAIKESLVSTVRLRLEEEFNEEEMFDPTVLRAIRNPNAFKSTISRLIIEEAPDLFSFPLLRPEFCYKLVAAAKQFEIDYQSAVHELVSGASTTPPSSLLDGLDFGSRLNGRGGLSLKTLGIERAFGDVVFQRVIKPLSDLLFSHLLKENPLDYYHSFLLEFGPPSPHEATSDAITTTRARVRSGLGGHTDDSEVTLNVGLGSGDSNSEFEGGSLWFGGIRGTENETTRSFEYRPTIGRAVVHLGQNIHSVKPVEKGLRYSFIMWCRRDRKSVV